jgi:hypothetical protein
VDNRVALHFDGTTLVGAVSSQANGRALRVRVDAQTGEVVEEPLAVAQLS